MGNSMFFEYDFNKPGFTTIVTPKNSTLKFINSGTLNLNNERFEIQTDNEEMGIFCIGGEASCEINRVCKMINKYDGLFIPPYNQVEIQTKEEVKMVWFSVPSNIISKPEIIYFAHVSKDPDTHFVSGSKETSSRRDVYQIISKKIRAARLLAGITIGDNGNWTSWPPHEHGAQREELYIFFDMPYPQFGIQMVYSGDITSPEICKVVKEGSAVAVPSGFHPNVAGPGSKLSYIFIMASLEEGRFREFSNVCFDKRFVEED